MNNLGSYNLGRWEGIIEAAMNLQGVTPPDLARCASQSVLLQVKRRSLSSSARL